MLNGDGERTSSERSDDTITQLIHRWAAGDSPAGARLFARVHAELRAVAHAQRRRWVGDDTLGTTALVNEVYLRLRAADELSASDRAHFFAIASRATRQVLSNYARHRRTERRGGDAERVPLDRADAVAAPANGDQDRLWDLELALEQLQALHPRPCRVVECRYFGGLSIPDTALALGISEATVKRDWALAQTWLYRALSRHRYDDDA
jgi:RNA polymerase sigma factor (TIGR02999 family)